MVTGLAPTAVDLQSLLTLLRPGNAADVGGVFVVIRHGSASSRMIHDAALLLSLTEWLHVSRIAAHAAAICSSLGSPSRRSPSL
ncbi:MAG: hypothetical protein EB117_13565 [Betaproteobacteria bacterium]|nr:hypothetical protein [Betaproteobacteria bacterium]